MSESSGHSQTPHALRVGDTDTRTVEAPVRELAPLPAHLAHRTDNPPDADADADALGDPIPADEEALETGHHISGIVTQQPKRARRGDIIGAKYVVDGQIGKGGMGRVLRVRHQVLGKCFALKVIRPPIATNKRMCEMFYREARLASALAHENICSIVDFGNDPDVGLFMVMELLEGMSLHKRLRQGGPLAPKAACSVMWDIAKAVKHMHDRSIVHGDIKSRNILLVRTNDKHRMVKLTDFGLARVDVARTSTRVEGTPEYMATELIRGHASSTHSDIYALGILFYEILVGKQPFKGDTEAIFNQHLHKPLPRPSELLDGAIDERADELIIRATAKNAAERHPDVESFLFELRTLMNMVGIGKYHRGRSTMEPPRPPRQQSRLSSHRIQGAAEVFEHAPIPMASVSPTGKVRVANKAFIEFLGVAGDAAGIELSDSHLPDVYPGLLDDLHEVATSRARRKHVLELTNRHGEHVQVVVILSAASNRLPVTAGDVYITLHPLSRATDSSEPPSATVHLPD